MFYLSMVGQVVRFIIKDLFSKFVAFREKKVANLIGKEKESLLNENPNNESSWTLFGFSYIDRIESLINAITIKDRIFHDSIINITDGT